MLAIKTESRCQRVVQTSQTLSLILRSPLVASSPNLSAAHHAVETGTETVMIDQKDSSMIPELKVLVCQLLCSDCVSGRVFTAALVWTMTIIATLLKRLLQLKQNNAKQIQNKPKTKQNGFVLGLGLF